MGVPFMHLHIATNFVVKIFQFFSFFSAIVVLSQDTLCDFVHVTLTLCTCTCGAGHQVHTVSAVTKPEALRQRGGM